MCVDSSSQSSSSPWPRPLPIASQALIQHLHGLEEIIRFYHAETGLPPGWDQEDYENLLARMAITRGCLRNTKIVPEGA